MQKGYLEVVRWLYAQPFSHYVGFYEVIQITLINTLHCLTPIHIRLTVNRM